LRWEIAVAGTCAGCFWKGIMAGGWPSTWTCPKACFDMSRYVSYTHPFVKGSARLMQTLRVCLLLPTIFFHNSCKT
jgi:hypothetical protein